MTTVSVDKNAIATEDISLFPTSLAQQRLWFLYQMEPQSPAYNLTANLGLKMPVDRQVLQASLNALIERHEALRTCFVTLDDLDGLPMQMIAPAFPLSLPLVDISELPERQQHEEVLRLANEEAQQPFDLEQVPLLRAKLLKLAEQDFLLLLTMHHIIADGWSINLFFHELSVLYDALLKGRPAPLPPSTLQYVDFAIYQQEYLKQNGLAEHLEYWKQQLNGASTTLALPTDRPRPLSHSGRGAHYLLTLPLELTEALKTLSREQGVTLYMTLVAAFQCMLYRYSSQEDILIGTVTSGRTLPGSESLFGFFVNTLVLRTDLSGSPTFHELLRRVREVVLQAHTHQEMPFDYLVRELQPERVSGQNPLFQVLLALDPPATASSPGWIPNPIATQTNTAKFDLSLELSEHAGGIDCTFEFSTDLFEEATIIRMADHWRTLLAGIVADPTLSVTDLPLLTAQEELQLLTAWHETRQHVSRVSSILPLFEEQVECNPDALAVVFEGQQLSYRQLNERANQLAHYLHSQGVGAEVMVGLCVERSLEVIVGLLGILKAGGVYAPLAPDAPAQRLSFQIEQTQMLLLLTQARLQERLSQAGVRLVCLDHDWEQIARYSTHNPSWQVSGEQLAYVIYTSGSTGQPKGGLIEHEALLTHCQNMSAEYHLCADDRILQFSSVVFDASLEQILPPLLAGARLILRGEQLWSPAQLLQQIEQQRISIINLPPAYWQQVAQAWSKLPPARGARSSLRLVILGGDQLPPEALRLWRETPWRAVQVLNAYGPTETTITATLYDTGSFLQQDAEQLRVPIGRSLPNRRTYLLDRVGQLVPMGVVGELYIGGESLARGYLKRADLTAERFVPDPFSGRRGARLYRTGDLARLLPDGTIEVLGRVDQQVKLRGFRIELGEIEAVLSQHPGVGEVAVLLREDQRAEKMLVAYVVARAGQSLEPQSLRRYVQEHLPAYMVPGGYVLLDALPWLPSGKLDRQALLRAELTRWTEEETFLAPQSPIQQRLVQIWEELITARPIGIRDNFFYLGGHSLLAARLVDRIEHVFGKSIALSTLFAGPTIEQLAAVLEPVHEAMHPLSPMPITREESADERAAIFPIQVKGSKRPFFFLHGDWGGGAFYCFTVARALGADQPFYVLAPYKFAGLRHLPSFEKVAAAHIDAIRTVQAKGPYLLGGFCNGGLLAYEMARQLAAVGERIDFLGLINPSLPIQFEKMRSVSKRINSLFHLSESKQARLFLGGRHALRHIYRTLNPTGARVEDFDKLLDLDPRLKAMFPPVEALYCDYVGVFSWLVSRYETGIYPGKITFYWASEEPFIEHSWLPVIAAKDSKDIERHIVPGTHMSCVTEHIQDLAACLSTCLLRVQEEALIPGQTRVAVGVSR